jgi:long-subunit acyl-CoA synthetase (AMP-forming)
MLMLVPPILVFLGKHPIVDKFDLSSVREIWCGAAPLSKEMQQSVTTRLGMNVVRQGYGLTETTFAVSINPLNCNIFGSSGTLIPGVSCKVKKS